MEENPYSALLYALRPEHVGIPELTLGRVSSAPTEDAPDAPLKVLVGGNTMEQGDLMKNADLAALSVGDAVLLLPIEEAQRYLIICKAVEA